MNHNETREKFKAWWSQLALREQRMLAFGSVVVVFFILYAGIWMPIQSHLEEMRVSIKKNEKTLQWMQSADKALSKVEGQAQEKKKTVTPVELLSIVQQTVEEAGLTSALTQSKQSSGESIILHFQKADFDRLMAMLIIILKEQNVTVTQFGAAATKDPGVVNADVTLKIG